MKTLLTLFLISLAITSHAEDPALPAPEGQTANKTWLAKAFAEDKKQHFNSGEWNIDAFMVADYSSVALEDGVYGEGLGVTYFVTRGLGIGARAMIFDTHSSFVDELEARLVFRAPLWDQFAPGAYVSGGYSLESYDWKAGAGGTFEVRFTRNLAVFAEAGLSLTPEGQGGLRGVGGVRIAF